MKIEPWLQSKLAEAEQKLRAREQAAQSWSEGTNEEWAAAANLHPSTAGKRSTKRERLANADAQGRMAEACGRDVQAFKVLLAATENIEALLATWKKREAEMMARVEDPQSSKLLKTVLSPRSAAIACCRRELADAFGLPEEER